MALDPITAGMDLIGKAIDRFVPDPAQAAQAKLAMYQAELANYIPMRFFSADWLLTMTTIIQQRFRFTPNEE